MPRAAPVISADLPSSRRTGLLPVRPETADFGAGVRRQPDRVVVMHHDIARAHGQRVRVRCPQDTCRPGRRTHRRDQPVAGRAWPWKRCKFAGIKQGAMAPSRSVRGIVNQDFADLTQETAANLERVAETPAAAAGLRPATSPTSKYCQEIFKQP